MRTAGAASAMGATLVPCALTSALLFATLATPARATPLSPGAVREIFVPAPSLGLAQRSVRVYLPPSYSLTAAARRRYPMIVFLHGGPGNNADWEGQGGITEILNTLIAKRVIPEVIGLMPDAQGIGHGKRSAYVNTWDGRVRIEDFLVRDLIAWADSALRTRPEASQRALIGISDGASAAVNLAFKHPDVFGACGGHSGEYVMRGDRGLERILGPEPWRSSILAANSPALYVRRVADRIRRSRIYFDCGLLDLGFLDERRLHRELAALGIPHTYREFWGFHGWVYWRAHLKDSLAAVTAGMW